MCRDDGVKCWRERAWEEEKGTSKTVNPRSAVSPSLPPLPSHSDDTQLAYIDGATGAILFDPAPGVGTFATEAAALAELEAVWQPPPPPATGGDARAALSPPPRAATVLATGTALLGYARYGTSGRALLVVRSAPRVAGLPGGHVVRRVEAAEWVRLPSRARAADATTTADDDWPPASRFRVDDLHYYCDTADVTRPFPGRRGVSRTDEENDAPSPPPFFCPPSDPVPSPSWEFVWNAALAAPLRAAGLPAACPHLLQGTAASVRLAADAPTPGGAPPPPLTLTLLTRASTLHAGTRYLARGLNAAASPGNEVEAEQVLWCDDGGGGNTAGRVRFASWVWRRGTVPVWWSVALKGGGVGEAAIEVAPRAPYRGTRRYFRRLQRRYCWREGGGGQGGSGSSDNDPPATTTTTDPSTTVPIHCINLLRCAMSRRDELLLSEHFAEGVRRAARSGTTTTTRPRPSLPLRLINFDWHAVTKDLGEAGAVEGLWSALRPLLVGGGVTVGTLTPAPSSPPPPPDGAWPHFTVTYTSRQAGILRFNCADSLDRTNAACYFACVAAAAECARALGRPAALGRPPPPHPMQEALAELPPGWEEAATPDGRVFFVDHTHRSTTWTRPPSRAETAAAAAAAAAAAISQPWGVAGMSVAAVAAALAPAPLAAHAAAHRAAGDAHARLYTASPAMHSGVLTLITGAAADVRTVDATAGSGARAAERAARRGADRVRNVGVSVARRWANVTGDAGRHAAAAAFLAGGAASPPPPRPPPEHDTSASESDGDGDGDRAPSAAAATAAALAEASDGPWSASESDGVLTAGASALSLVDEGE